MAWRKKVYHEAKDISTDEVVERLEKLKKRFDNGDFSIIDKSNVTYRACSDGIKRLTLKGKKRSQLRPKKRERIIFMVGKMLERIRHNIRTTPGKTAEERDLVDVICCTIGCTTSSVYVNACETGFVAGPLSWKEKDLEEDRKYDWDGESRIEGVAVPPPYREISDLVLRKERKPLFILVVENQTILRHIRLSEFCNKWPCILISGNAYGMPDVSTRRFLKLLSDKFYDLPVYGLFDCNPQGIRIFTWYTVGSKAKAYDSVNLTCPSMRWVGLCPTDLSDYDIPRQILSQAEIKKVQDLLDEKFVKQNPMLAKELKHMKKTKSKAHFKALKDKFGMQWPGNFLESKIISDFYI